MRFLSDQINTLLALCKRDVVTLGRIAELWSHERGKNMIVVNSGIQKGLGSVMLHTACVLWLCLVLSVVWQPVAAIAAADKYAGAINSHYGVSMILEQNGKSLSGSYGYTDSTSLKLRGFVDDSGKFSMEESDSKGKVSGSFEGRIINHSRLVGTWRDAGRKKKMPFLLAKVGNAASLDNGIDGIIVTQKVKKVRKPSGSMVPQAVLSYPVVDTKFIPDAAVAKRIVGALSGEPIYGDPIGAMEQNILGGDGWLDEASYVVNYNGRYVFDGDFTISGCGAYPDQHTNHVLLNLRTGKTIKATDAFLPGSLKALEAMVKQKVAAAVSTAKKEHREDLKEGDYSDLFRLDTKINLLDQFSVSDSGVTFLYDWGFPHVAQALEPDGRFFLPFDAVKSFVRKDGALSEFVK